MIRAAAGHASCLAGIAPENTAMLDFLVGQVGLPAIDGVSALNVTEIGRLAPEMLVCDLDALAVDPLEFLRQVRFVLPQCLVVVYTESTMRSWALSCHLAGANCLLAKSSSPEKMLVGLREALRLGCHTDPIFARGGN